MQNVSVSRRYARALLDVAGANADTVLSQLEALTKFFEEQHDVWVAASNPSLSRVQRMGVVEAVVKNASALDGSLVNLLKLMSDRNRFEILPGVTRQFRDLVDARMGRLRGKVTSATKLSADQLASVQKSLESLTSKKVMLEANVDPKILGGVIAQVGSKTFDGSIRAQLDDMKQKLTQPGR